MKSIFGRINFSGAALDKSLFKIGLSGLNLFSLEDSKLYQNTGFGHACFHSFSPILEQDNLLILSDSKIYNKKELANSLRIDSDNISDDELILFAFKKWKYDCPKHLIGDFAFAIWNSNTQELFCARDHLGVKPFHYSFGSEGIVFSSEISAILSQNDIDFTIDDLYIADSLLLTYSEKERTNYREIKKLPPASSLIIKKGRIHQYSYWELSPQKPLALNENQIVEQFKALLVESVECRLGIENKTGSELSGGIDSSGITALASNSAELNTFSHVLPGHLIGKIHPFNDERDFISQVIDYCGVKHSHFITSEKVGLLEELKQNLNELKYLTQQNFSVFSSHLYEKAKGEGINILLSGFGGDEAVSSYSNSYLLDLAYQKRWSVIKKELKTYGLSLPGYFKTILKLYFKTKVPKSSKIIDFLRGRKPWWVSKYKEFALSKSFSRKLNLERRFYAFHKKPQRYLLQEKTVSRITQSHISQRLEYSSVIARNFGIEYRYPLLDIRLIEFYLSVPSNLKAKNNIGRYIFRIALEGQIPKNIQYRKDKTGATVPTVTMRMLNDKEKILELIARAKQNELVKKYINLDKLELWFESLCKSAVSNFQFNNPGGFHNYIKLILFIEQNPSLFK